ncbi:hypothetical protein KP509_32G001600 [Ceratopteris richardii]|uniref:Uncharacterized protein n=1 Tax=Ceratopteris richardii TaxID=49495 RepID=A0A8T2QRW2_CERRI|nr:hypothetical protein KP509_32G001600 [Ceratopteris richardii]
MLPVLHARFLLTLHRFQFIWVTTKTMISSLSAKYFVGKVFRDVKDAVSPYQAHGMFAHVHHLWDRPVESDANTVCDLHVTASASYQATSKKGMRVATKRLNLLLPLCMSYIAS